ncbi:MAG: Methyltransferase, FkbM family, partial [Daejeonella sp.]|nr:Methyltransferase, FkbM family [Daejeonella sp.]
MIKKNIISILKKTGYRLERINKIENHYSKNSYSQCGEDLIIQYIFNLRGISQPSYVDIGAN